MDDGHSGAAAALSMRSLHIGTPLQGVKARTAGTASVLLACAVACGGGSRDVTTSPPLGQSVANVAVQPTDTSVSVGASVRFGATLRDEAGRAVTGKGVSWSSSNPSVAAIDPAGTMTALAIGTITITATSEGKSGVARVVVQIPVARITYVGARQAVAVGEDLVLMALPLDSNGQPLTGRRLQWSSSNPAIATVTQEGRVSGITTGAAEITVAAEGRSAVTPIAVVFAVVTANFASPVSNVRSVNGLLHGLNFSGQPAPPDALIAPLRPSIWRATENVVPISIARSVGGKYTIILSDHWGYPPTWRNGKPYENVVAYEAMMRNLARSLNGQVAVWEVWNEPDPAFGPNFWEGTELQFFQTYLVAYRALRDVLGPLADIAGPSITRYQPDYLRRFADFCLANGCEINVLTWHEMGADRPLSTIADHIRTIRRDIVDNPAYAALRIREVHINESIGPSETYNPAAALTYNYYLELGGADAAARACWGGTGADSDCFNNSLDGLITPITWKPRSVWWAHKLYADGVSSRVRSSATDPRVFALASRTSASPSAAQVLTGISNVQNGTVPASPVLAVRLTGLSALPFLPGQTRVQLRVSEIPNTDTLALDAPKGVLTSDVSIVDDAAEVIIPQGKPNAVYVVSVHRIP